MGYKTLVISATTYIRICSSGSARKQSANLPESGVFLRPDVLQKPKNCIQVLLIQSYIHEGMRLSERECLSMHTGMTNVSVCIPQCPPEFQERGLQGILTPMSSSMPCASAPCWPSSRAVNRPEVIEGPPLLPCECVCVQLCGGARGEGGGGGGGGGGDE